MPIITSPAESLISDALKRRVLLPVASLLFFISPGSFAEQTEPYLDEPIFPIPKLVVFDVAKAAIGEKLFSDVRLSKNQQISCASCHQLDAGGDDNLTVGISSSAERHVINTPTVFNAQFNFKQNWDGSINTLTEQIESVVSGQHEFNNSWQNIIDSLERDIQMVDAFNSVYSDGITRDNITEALVEFEKSLYTPDSPFDRYLRNEDHSLSGEEVEGYRLFKDLGCISCHQGVNIGGNLYQKFGVFYNYIAERGNVTKVDYGRMNITDRYADAFVFKVPSLRNVAVTAPYLHDGSAATLDEVISIMGKTQLGRILSEEEVHLIKAFLKTLTGKYNNNSLDEML